MDPKSMTCLESSGNLLARFRQELSTADSEEIEGHLAHCRACRLEVDEIESLDGLISSLPEVEPSTDSWSRMLMMIEAEETPIPKRRGRGRLIALASILAAACLLLLMLPTAKTSTLIAGPGEILLNGAPVSQGDRVELPRDASIEARTMSLVGLTVARPISMVLAAGTRIVRLPDGNLRLLDGRAHVTVVPGEHPVRFYAVGDTYVEVTGTVFDLLVDGQGTTATVAVAKGRVRVWTGKLPVLVIQGQSLTFGPDTAPAKPVAAESGRLRDWCSTPTASLSRDADLLRLTLSNDTVQPLKVVPFDPHQAVYSLLIEGPEIRLPVKIQERMVRGMRASKREFRTLAPGESYDLLIDSSALDLARGTYRVSAVYKPYPSMPDDVWHGPPLTTEALTLTVE